LDSELQSTKDALEQGEAELAARPLSPGSSSTGVQVLTLPKKKLPKNLPSPNWMPTMMPNTMDGVVAGTTNVYQTCFLFESGKGRPILEYMKV
jgi:hypothetical protein